MTDMTPVNTALAELKSAAVGLNETRQTVESLQAKMHNLETEIGLRPTRNEAVNLSRMVDSILGDTRGNNSGAISLERKAVGDFVRTGKMDLETRGWDATTAANGASTLPKMMADQIARAAFDLSPMARLARRVYITEGSSFDQPIVTTLPGAEWVTDTGARSAQTSPAFSLASIPLCEISTIVPVTQRLIDDSHYDIGAMVEGIIVEKFGQASGTAFIMGGGTTDPKGLLTYTTAATADAARAWFTLEHIPTGVAGGWAASNPADVLIDMVYKLKAKHRQNAKWLMNRKTAAAVRKFKDSQGNYLWVDGLALGQPNSLLGFAVELDEEMPDIAANSLSVAFGDFDAAYTVVARTNMNMLRDPYSTKGSILFYVTARFGGGLVNSQAVKLLKFSVA